MSFRKSYFTRPIHRWAKGVLPTLSATEAEAINSGDVHFEAELFSGKPDWTMLRHGRLTTTPGTFPPRRGIFCARTAFSA